MLEVQQMVQTETADKIEKWLKYSRNSDIGKLGDKKLSVHCIGFPKKCQYSLV